MIDSHCHLDAAAFEEDREQVLQRAAQAGVRALVIPAVGEDTWEPILALCREQGEKTPALFPALGIHPIALPKMDPNLDDAVLEGLEQRARVDFQQRQRHTHSAPPDGARDATSDGARSSSPEEDPTQKSTIKSSPNTALAPSWVAIGECGLDSTLNLDSAPLERQARVLRRQMRLAKEVQLPLIFHCRGPHTHQLLLDLLESEGLPQAGGVIHSYSGGVEFLKRFLPYPLFFGFAGPATWPKARKVRASIAAIPPERLLVETDAPDQCPEPQRPGRNEPAFLAHIVAGVAQARGVSEQEIRETSSENARRLFGLSR